MRIALAALVLALATAGPARAELVQQAENGFVVQHSVTVSTDPDTSFAMLRTPAKWWDKDHTWTGNAENLYMDAQAGGCFCELIPNEATTESGAPQRTLRGSVQHMQIVYVDPGKLLRLTGALGPLQSEAVTGALTFTLKPVKGGTRISMDYVAGGFMRMKTSQIAPAVDAVMVAQLSRLGMALGPLVGAGDTPAAEPDSPEDSEEQPADEAATGNDVSALVSDLAPDDAVTQGSQADEIPAPKTAAKPDPAAGPAPRRSQPGARPLTPPARSDEDEQGGR